MKIVIAAQGSGLDAEPGPVFGRSPVFLFVGSETRQVEPLANPAGASAGGAGVQAAQLVGDREASAVITGRLGQVREALERVWRRLAPRPGRAALLAPAPTSARIAGAAGKRDRQGLAAQET